MSDERHADIRRATAETDIGLVLDIDGAGVLSGGSGCGFFDHMLAAFCGHGLFDLSINVKADTHIDYHHCVEDVGIALGRAFAQALGDKRGIWRCGNCSMPMDEALATVALDISGRGYVHFSADFAQERVGGYDTCLTVEFLRAFAVNGGITLHASCTGDNSHHMTEAIFKALGRALRQACSADGRRAGVPSTKGVI